jgi:tetratricopeptide (TPR) repeat protein
MRHRDQTDRKLLEILEENAFLDIADNTGALMGPLIRTFEIAHLLAILPCLLLVTLGCALPRIIVLRDPLTPEEHVNLGVAYEAEGEFDNAIREYELAAKKLPVAHLYLGNAYFRKGDLDRAEAHYRTSIRKAPRQPDAYNNLAWLYYVKRENLDEAERLALKAIEIDPLKESIYQDTLRKIREVEDTP